MRKIIAIILAVLLVLCMTVPALAVTPKLKVPNMPKIPTIKAVKIELPNNFWRQYVFKEVK